MNEEEKILEIAKGIGYKVGTYCNDEEIEVFEKFLEDYKYKSNLIEKQQAEIETQRDIIVRHIKKKVKLEAELEKKDKIIHLMARELKQRRYIFSGGRGYKFIIDFFTQKIEKGE